MGVLVEMLISRIGEKKTKKMDVVEETWISLAFSVQALSPVAFLCSYKSTMKKKKKSV